MAAPEWRIADALHLAVFRAEPAAEQAASLAPGFTFTHPDYDARRHQTAPPEGRQHTPTYFLQQEPDDRRQPEHVVSFSDMRQPASAYHGGGVQQPRRQYPHVVVGAGQPDGREYLRRQGRDGQQHDGPGRVVQQAFRADQSDVQQHGYSPPTPLQTPGMPPNRDPSAMHLQWLQQQYDAERVSADRDPAVLDSLIQQMQATTNAMYGIATPPKGVSHGGADTHDSTPEYKLSGASVLAMKDDTKSANEMIKALGLNYEEANKDTRLVLDTSPKRAQEILQRLNDTMHWRSRTAS